MFTELFIAGTFWFWALIVAEIVLLFVFVNYENGIGALVSLVAFTCCLQFFGDTDIWLLITTRPWLTGVVVAGYILLSVPWGVFRWQMFCRDRIEEYEDKKADFLRRKGVSAKIVPPEHRAEWKKEISQSGGYGNQALSETPLVRYHKAFVTRAMSLWLIDAFVFIFGDMFVRLWKRLYNSIAGMLQRMADSMFAKSNISQDLDVEDEEEDT